MGRYADIVSDMNFAYGNNSFHIKIKDDKITISSPKEEFKFDGEVKANYSVSSITEATPDTVVIKKWLDDVKSELNKQIKEVEQKGSDDKEEILAKLDNEIQTVNEAIDLLEKNIDVKIEILEDSISAVNDAINLLEKNVNVKIGILADNISSVNQKTEENANGIQQANRRIDKAQTEISSIEEKIKNIPSDVKQIVEKVNAHETRINNLEKDVEIAKEDIKKNLLKIQDINSSIVIVNRNLYELSKKTIINTSDINFAKSEIKKINTNLNELRKHSDSRDDYLQREVNNLYEITKALDKRVTELEKHRPVPPVPPPPPVPPVPPPKPPKPPVPPEPKHYKEFLVELYEVKEIESITEVKKWIRECIADDKKIELYKINGKIHIYEYLKEKQKMFEEMSDKYNVWYWSSEEHYKKELVDLINSIKKQWNTKFPGCNKYYSEHKPKCKCECLPKK